MAQEPNRFQIEMGLQRLREIENDPEWRTFIRHLDDALESQIRLMPMVWPWYDFFDSPTKPINPREFLDFWSSLTWEDEMLYKLYLPAEVLKGE
ncbi:hypothetical protein SEA_PHERRYCRUZ_49 [Streptomyces phage PherryCruz]|nr:hypothetical protein SEA_PHERRYCRUZ_49 [Streptomyces phage PherryCruz]